MGSRLLRNLRALIRIGRFRSSEALLPDVQSTLAALADVECRYAVRQERVDRWPGPEAAKRRLSARLERRRRRERAPIVHRLQRLEHRMMAFR
jgi:hypothetical protein